LEDVETGDVHMPLIYMKAVFEANYSRKLSSLKNRLVVLPDESETDGEGEGGEDKASQGFLYWKWAFESPHEVKVLVRKMLGEENTPSGHLRLVLLPIVYNAMSQKSELRTSVLFKRLHGAMKRSAYYPMLKHPPPGTTKRYRLSLLSVASQYAMNEVFDIPVLDPEGFFGGNEVPNGVGSFTRVSLVNGRLP
jgi:hypothetical protein